MFIGAGYWTPGKSKELDSDSQFYEIFLLLQSDFPSFLGQKNDTQDDLPGKMFLETLPYLVLINKTSFISISQIQCVLNILRWTEQGSYM